MKHTPTPWKINDQRHSGWMDKSIYIFGDYNLAKLYDDNKQAEANAAFIVRACNAHEVYEQALIAIAMDAFAEPKQAWAIANAALKLARGEA